MINLINVPSSFDDMMNDPVIADYFNKSFVYKPLSVIF